MAIFCGKCGSKLDEKSGLCPKCDMATEMWQRGEKTANTNSTVIRSKKCSGKARISCVIFIGLAALILVILFFTVEADLSHTNGSEAHMASQADTPLVPVSSEPPVETAAAPSPQEAAYAKAETLLARGNKVKAAMAFGKLGDYADARMRSFELWEEFVQRETVSAGGINTVGLKTNGTISCVVTKHMFQHEKKQCERNVSSWTDIVEVSAGGEYIIALKSDGTVEIAVVINDFGQFDVSGWTDIVNVSAGEYHTVGLKSDGTVVADGSNHNGQCDVSDWRDIVAISAGKKHTVGLKSDGTVVATSFTDEWEQKYYCGQCDVSDWRDIVAISAGKEHTVGLKSDGTVVAAGSNEDGQCNVADWTEIVAISAGDAYTVGLRKDGTVVAVGDNYYDQCRVASRWNDIVAVSAGSRHVIGLKSDGTVVATGLKFTGLCDVSDWTSIRLPMDSGAEHTALAVNPECDHIFEVLSEKNGIGTS